MSAKAERLGRKIDDAIFRVFNAGWNLAGKVIRLETESRGEVWDRLRQEEKVAHQTMEERTLEAQRNPTPKNYSAKLAAEERRNDLVEQQFRVPRETSIVLLDRARVVLHTKVDEQKPWRDWWD